MKRRNIKQGVIIVIFITVFQSVLFYLAHNSIRLEDVLTAVITGIVLAIVLPYMKPDKEKEEQ